MPDSTPPNRIVITGAGGQLGKALRACSDNDIYSMVAFTSTQWDITDPTRAYQILKKDDIVINCAAYTDVDKSESCQEIAYTVNAIGPKNLAQACADLGAKLIHLSTDYVFSGQFGHQLPRPYRPDDNPDPLNVYGASKLAGERFVHAIYPDATVVRTSWVYTATGDDFITAMRLCACRPGFVRVVDDQIGSPTYSYDLARALLDLLHLNTSGRTIHLAGNQAVTRYQQAQSIFAAIGEDPGRVYPIKTKDCPRPAIRPIYSVLDSTTEMMKKPLRGWKEGLVAALVASQVDTSDNLHKRIDSFYSD